MCGFTCHMFGAGYEDGLCIDGYMWDLDSMDFDRELTSGGEIPCPRCKTADYLTFQARNAAEDLPNSGDLSPAEIWESTLRSCLEIKPSETAKALRQMPPFKVADWPGRIDTPVELEDDCPDLVFRRWPWSVPGLSNHVQISILPPLKPSTGDLP